MLPQLQEIARDKHSAHRLLQHSVLEAEALYAVGEVSRGRIAVASVEARHIDAAAHLAQYPIRVRARRRGRQSHCPYRLCNGRGEAQFACNISVDEILLHGSV